MRLVQSKRIFLVLMIFAAGCAATAYTLTIADIEPLLKGTTLGEGYGLADEGGLVEYLQIGDHNFDAFFKSAARLDGIVILTMSMTTTATNQLKKYAISKVANEAMAANIAGLVGDTPPEEWTTAQSIAVLKMAKAQDQISGEELKYFATTGLSLAIGVLALGKGVKETATLIKSGGKLLANVTSINKFRIPAAMKGIKASLKNLKGVKNNAPRALEEMVVLVKGFKALGEM